MVLAVNQAKANVAVSIGALDSCLIPLHETKDQNRCSRAPRSTTNATWGGGEERTFHCSLGKREPLTGPLLSRSVPIGDQGLATAASPANHEPFKSVDEGAGESGGLGE